MKIDIYYDINYFDYLVVVENERQNLWWIEKPTTLLHYLTNIYYRREILHNDSSLDYVHANYIINHIASIVPEDIPTIQSARPELFI